MRCYGADKFVALQIKIWVLKIEGDFIMRDMVKKTFVFLVVIFGVSAVFGAKNNDDKKFIIFTTHGRTTAEELNEIMVEFADLSHDCNVKVGMSQIYDFLHKDPKQLCEDMIKFLDAAEEISAPVLLKIDLEQFWRNRPDLWNWWDPEKPGYDPGNRYNVDWTSWSPDDALKIAWRNWGTQLRVLPPPNLMSPAYRKAVNETFDIFLPSIMKWYKDLPEDKKYLFVGIVLGGETAIGYNAYYYPNGNELLDKPAEDDPDWVPVRADALSRGFVQLGYSSVKTAGIRTSGDITEEDILEVCRRHLESLSKYVYDFGFPREKIFTHGVGNEQGEMLYDAAVNQYSCPGWSAYWYMGDISKDTGIMRNIEKTDAVCWAIPESLVLKPYYDEKSWYDALVDVLSYDNCKYICFNNWEGVIRKQDGEKSRVAEATKRAIRNYQSKTEK